MAKRIKIEGQRFGMLTVEEYVGNGNYRCVCDCGRITIADGKNIRTGHTTSCGCVKNNDLAGRRFGGLHVIERLPTKKRKVFWLCKCDCGTFCSARHDLLVAGLKTSCGCATHDKDIPPELRSDFINGTQLSKIVSKPTAANKSGIVGVNFDKSRNKWMAGIRFQGKRYNLGRYDTVDEAATIRKAAEEALFGDFLQWYEIATGKEKQNED